MKVLELVSFSGSIILGNLHKNVSKQESNFHANPMWYRDVALLWEYFCGKAIEPEVRHT